MFENLIRLSVIISIFIEMPLLADLVINNISEEVIIKGMYLLLGWATIHFLKGSR